MTDAHLHPSGYFGPGSITWKISREAVLLLGARRALLMQLAHPLVAQGVSDHSNLEHDRFGRLFRTLIASTAVVFGPAEEANKVLARVNSVHQSVRGVLTQDAGVWKAGTEYRADQPDLLMWVHATLVDTALVFYQKFVAPLSPEELESYYSETLAPTEQLGIPSSVVPRTYDKFCSYLQQEIVSRRVVVSAVARRLAGPILYPKVMWLPDRLFDPLNIVTIGTLPAEIREGYGLRWNSLRQALLNVGTITARRLIPLAPSLIRFIPQARAAIRRASE